MKVFSFLKDRINKKTQTDIQEDNVTKSTVIYNTGDNVIILVSFSTKDIDDVAEFVEACYNANLHTITERDSNLCYKEDTEVKELVAITHVRHYIIIGGSPRSYGELYKYVSLSNTILECITEDIYNNCSSTYFKKSIEDGVLDINKFVYNKIIPKYDEYVYSKDKSVYCDDITYILSKIPKCYTTINLTKIVNIYIKSKDINGVYIYTIRNFIKVYNAYKKNGIKNIDYNETYEKIKHQLFHKIMAPKNDCLDDYTFINLPIYMIEDYDPEYVGDKSIEEMDEIFQQQYDRFVTPTIDNVPMYDESVDDIIGDTEEEENIREVDKL